MRLAQAGLERDVAVAIRTTFELFVKLKAGCTDPDFTDRLDDDELIHKRKLANANLQNRHIDQEARARIQQHAAKLDVEIKKRNAKPIKVEQLAQKVGMANEYDTVYRMTSPFVHGTGRVLEDYVYRDPDGSFGGFEIGPSDAETDLYVDTLTEYLLLATDQVAHLFDVDVSSQLKALHNRLASISGEDAEGEDE